MFETIGFIVSVILGLYLLIQAVGSAFVIFGFTGRIEAGEAIIMTIVFILGLVILYFAFSNVSISFTING